MVPVVPLRRPVSLVVRRPEERLIIAAYMRNADKQLEWIDSEGGPLILLEQTALHHWKVIYSDQKPTDYDRACAIDEYIGLIDVGNGKAVVLGDMPMSTSWLSLPNEPGGLIVRWGCANDENDVNKALTLIPEEVWSDTGISFQVRNGDLILFDSACEGEDITESLRIKLVAGRHIIRTADYKPDKETWLVLHKLKLMKNSLGDV